MSAAPSLKDLYVCELGRPLPEDPHAVSVSLPKWADVVGYEEGKPEVLSALSCGYPRFVYHELYRELCARYACAAGERVLVFPSLAVARKCVAYAGAGRAEETGDGVALAVLPEGLAGKGREFWQHAGMIVSSRRAEEILKGVKARPVSKGAGPAPDAPRGELRGMVAGLHGAAAGDVFLYPSGMGAIFGAYEAVSGLGGPRTVQLGFPYVDTLKVQQKFGAGVYVPYADARDLEKVEALVKAGGIAAVFCEVPGNPLLRVIDLPRLSAILRGAGVPLVVDDTLGPPCNIDLMPFADVVVTSLTKFFSGIGNVTGGSLVLNEKSPHYAALKARVAAGHEDLLWPGDAAVLLENGRNFRARMDGINANALRLAGFLRAHPAVAEVFYPKGDAAYEAIRRDGGGYGGLLSFTLKDPLRAPEVYDRLEVAKGPSLGTEFTLASPYTLLAHYNELDFARANGVAPDLIRVSVGMEDGEGIVARFGAALG